MTLRRLDLAAEIYPIREPQKIPPVMSQDETRRLLAVAGSLKVRTLLSLGYGCGLRMNSSRGRKARELTGCFRSVPVEVRGAAEAKAPVIEKLGLHLVRTVEDASPATAAAAAVKVVTPSGKTGFVPADAIRDIGGPQMCFVKPIFDSAIY